MESVVAKISRRRFALTALLGGTSLTASSCGTLMYPERKGRRHSRTINKKVFWYDFAGIVLFGGLGIIGMMIDFNNGTMYLPAGQHAALGGSKKTRLVAFRLPKGHREQRDYEAVASAHFGRSISFDDPSFRWEKLKSKAQFFPAARRLLGREPHAPVAQA